MGSAKKYDVVAFGVAVNDIGVTAEDHHLEKHGLEKGLGATVDIEKLENITAEFADAVRTAGGPGTNVVVGIALRGGSSAMVGKIANDEHGDFFAARLEAHGVDYMPLLSSDETHATTCVLVLTTPDRERTFVFNGGAGYHLSPEDVDSALLEQASIVYFDSYLWHGPQAKETLHHAASETKKSGGKVAVALNDANLVARNRTDVWGLAGLHADILLGDSREFMTLFGTRDMEETIAAVSALGLTAAITAGASGAWVVENGKSAHIPVKKVEKIVDTCGAGDQFAAGFLYGLAQGKTAEESGHIGAQWASDVIQHRGAEPQIGKNAPKTPPVPPPPGCCG